jgi:hypothetical protein
VRAWKDEQHFEADWWGDCSNTFGEDLKHPTYARLMGMEMGNDGGKVGIDLQGHSVLDVGGGPTSMTLKTFRPGHRTVVDPCPYPDWVAARYEAAGVEYLRIPAEELSTDRQYDEAWCYNVLQHVQDPQTVINAMLERAKVVRVFEWVNLPPHPGHPHELHAEELAAWMGIKEDLSNGFWRWWPEDTRWDHYVWADRFSVQAFGGYVHG